MTQVDAAEYISTVLPTIEPAFVYLDPPYYVKGSGLYQNFYSHEDHAAIAKLVDDIRQPWMVSYDAAPEVEELYANHNSIAYDLSYSAQDRYKGRERIFLKPGLRAPAVDTPANVPWRLVDQARMAYRA
jgi:DNA adenine methylase